MTRSLWTWILTSLLLMALGACSGSGGVISGGGDGGGGGGDGGGGGGGGGGDGGGGGGGDGGGGGGNADDDLGGRPLPTGLRGRRGPWAKLAFPLQGPAPTPMDVVNAFPRLVFDQPVFLTHAPDGSDRLFVVEQDGRIHVFANRSDVDATTVFLDLRAKVRRNESEEGLLGLAFDPAFRANRFFYVNYSASTPRRSVVARYTVSAQDADVADPASEKILLELEQPAGNHNGGMLAFGPDDLLYTAFGDGGSGGDPWGNGQNPSTLLGGMLRIDPHGSTRGLPYGIPADNPWIGVAGTREELWAIGLRNPWRFSFDRQTGELWLADVGQGRREEVDLVRRGGNYAWDVYEGDLEFENPRHDPPSAFDQPLFDYDRADGASVTGGYVYRGSRLPELRGAYIYGDWASGRVWALVAKDGKVVSNTEIARMANVSAFGEDEHGELYGLFHSAGTVGRLERRGGGGDPFPTRLSMTGLFDDTATLEVAAGVLEYAVRSPLWSDGASKRRWIVLPADARIDYTATDAWQLPVGTVLVKHFEIETTVGDPTTRRRLETRVLVHESTGWAGYTYRWNAAQTDAELLAGRAEETLTIHDRTGPRQQRWVYPGRTDCWRCHTEERRVLGIETLQLNHDVIIDRVLQNQIAHWQQQRMFTADVPKPPPELTYADPFGKRPVGERARSYLAANCAMCHQPGNAAPTDIDLRFATPDAATNLIGVRPTRGDLGLTDAYRIKPGVKESSVLWERLRRLDGTRMPPFASHLVHERALALIGAWIDG